MKKNIIGDTLESKKAEEEALVFEEDKEASMKRKRRNWLRMS